MPQDTELGQGELRAEPTPGKMKTLNHHAVYCFPMITPLLSPFYRREDGDSGQNLVKATESRNQVRMQAGLRDFAVHYSPTASTYRRV